MDARIVECRERIRQRNLPRAIVWPLPRTGDVAADIDHGAGRAGHGGVKRAIDNVTLGQRIKIELHGLGAGDVPRGGIKTDISPRDLRGKACRISGSHRGISPGGKQAPKTAADGVVAQRAPAFGGGDHCEQIQ